MKAAIYARYSSENQRPESIEDQISACRKFANERAYVLSEQHIFADQAASGARRDRAGLAELLAAAEAEAFEVVLVDDLSRLARDNYLMLSVLAELRFNGVRVVSVADGLDSDDEEATLGIQVRGIFNELQLRDLRKKTLRGQIGQKERGFFVGERTFGYKSVPVGTVRMDKKGRPRPEGYRMDIEPREAAVVLRVFQEFADGAALTKIVRRLNEEGVAGRFSSKRWSPATVTRILRNEKYVGRWIWNRSEFRREPRTGRRRRFSKPEREWLIRSDDSLRIVPQQLWERVQGRLQEIAVTWPGRRGKRGFEVQRGGRVAHYPTHLLSGAMSCGLCGNTIAQVSGKAGGYYGCQSATRGKCENKLLVRRTTAERVIVSSLREKLTQPENLRYVLERVADEVAKLCSDLPETIRLKCTELQAEERRIANFLDFIGEGRGSKALAGALLEAERKAEVLRGEVADLERSRESAFEPPPLPWIEERLVRIQELLERRTERSALLLRKVLSPIRLEPVRGDIGRPYYRAASAIDVLALLEPDPNEKAGDSGSNSLQQWS